MDKFLETYNLPRLNHEELENLNRPFISNRIEWVIKKQLPTHESPGSDGFTGKLYYTFKEELISILPKLFKSGRNTSKVIL